MSKELTVMKAQDRIKSRIQKLEQNTNCHTDQLSDQWSKLAVFLIPLNTRSCQTCQFLKIVSIHQGVGLQCEAKFSPSALASPAVNGIDFCKSHATVEAQVEENITNTANSEFNCRGYQH
jgi:hypothetical protein